MDAHAHQHHHHQQQHRAVLAVDLDHTLAQLLESAFDWRNAETGSAVRLDRLSSCTLPIVILSLSFSLSTRSVCAAEAGRRQERRVAHGARQ